MSRHYLMLAATTALASSFTAPALGAELDCAAVAKALTSDQTEAQAALVTDIDPTSVEGKTLASDLGAICRVSGTTSPVEGSRIGFEVWMPAEGWNGRLQMFGNGGYSSSMPFDRVSQATARGYAVAVTDTGHQGSDPDFARDRPEAIDDWAYRAVHETINQAKTAVGAYYGKSADYAYFDGCSTGGQQAFSQAQRYPGDFDGIIAGAPGHNRTRLNAGFLWLYLSNHEAGVDDRQIVPNEKLPMVAEAVFAQCKAQRAEDAAGLASDPFLNDPLSCTPDLQVLVCADGDGADCLTRPEADALQAMYDGPRDAATGERIYFGWPVGSENAGANPERPGWSNYWSDFASTERPARVSFWQIWAFDDENWSWWDVDLGPDMTRADDRLAERVNAMDPDLRPFRDAGGKMIHYHGLADPVVPAADSISYWRRVQQATGGSEDFHRLFLVPGMEHCGGGSGPNRLFLQSQLEAWVEQGVAPERIEAAHYEAGDAAGSVLFTRPLCPYPQQAFYDGTGPENDAASFECRAADEPQFEDLGHAWLR